MWQTEMCLDAPVLSLVVMTVPQAYAASVADAITQGGGAAVQAYGAAFAQVRRWLKQPRSGA